MVAQSAFWTGLLYDDAALGGGGRAWFGGILGQDYVALRAARAATRVGRAMGGRDGA